MRQPATIVSPPLLKGKTEIIERGLIGIKKGAVIGIKKGAVGIRPYHVDVLRRQFQDLSKLAFALPDLLLRLLCRGDVHHRSDKLYEAAFLIDDRMSDRMEVLDSSGGMHNAVVRFIVCFLDFGLFEKFLNAFCVLRMISIEPKFSIRLILIGSHAVYSIHFRRDDDSPRSNVMFPAACMAQSLRFEQLCFAVAQFRFRLLCSGHVGYGAHKFEILSRSPQRATYDVDVLHRTIRHQQTILKIKIRSHFGRTVASLLYAVPIVGMNSLHDPFQRGLGYSIVFENFVGLL